MNQVRGAGSGGIRQALVVGVVLALAAGQGWLAAQAGLGLTLRMAGALVLPLLVMTALVQASRKQIAGLTAVLALALYALAAAGMWGLLRD